MSNLSTAFWILFGTYVCHTNPSAFIEDGSYDWSMGIVTGVVIFGALSLVDLIVSSILKIPALHNKFLVWFNK